MNSYTLNSDVATISGKKFYANGKPVIASKVEIVDPITEKALGEGLTNKYGYWEIKVPVENIPTGTYDLRFYGSGLIQKLAPFGDWEPIQIVNTLLALSKTIKVNASSRTVQEKLDGSFIPATGTGVILTATTKNTKNPKFVWSKNDVEISGIVSDTYTITSDDYPAHSDVYRVDLYDPDYRSSDWVTITRLVEGSATINVVLTNEHHNIEADIYDKVLDGELGLLGETQTKIEVFQGITSLSLVGGEATPGEAHLKSAQLASGTLNVDFVALYPDTVYVESIGTRVLDGYITILTTVNISGLNDPIGSGIYEYSNTFYFDKISASYAGAGRKGKDGIIGRDGRDGIVGRDGSVGPGLVYKGLWNYPIDYLGSTTVRDVVQDPTDTFFYYCIKTHTSSVALQPKDSSAYWTKFSNTFDSVATDLLLAKDVSITRSLTLGTYEVTPGNPANNRYGILRSPLASGILVGDGFYLKNTENNRGSFRVGHAVNGVLREGFYYDGVNNTFNIKGTLNVDGSNLISDPNFNNFVPDINTDDWSLIGPPSSIIKIDGYEMPSGKFITALRISDPTISCGVTQSDFVNVTATKQYEASVFITASGLIVNWGYQLYDHNTNPIGDYTACYSGILDTGNVCKRYSVKFTPTAASYIKFTFKTDSSTGPGYIDYALPTFQLVSAQSNFIGGWSLSDSELVSADASMRIDANGSISGNYSPSSLGVGGTGWKIESNGNAEFNNAVLRGGAFLGYAMTATDSEGWRIPQSSSVTVPNSTLAYPGSFSPWDYLENAQVTTGDSLGGHAVTAYVEPVATPTGPARLVWPLYIGGYLRFGQTISGIAANSTYTFSLQIKRDHLTNSSISIRILQSGVELGRTYAYFNADEVNTYKTFKVSGSTTSTANITIEIYSTSSYNRDFATIYTFTNATLVKNTFIMDINANGIYVYNSDNSYMKIGKGRAEFMFAKADFQNVRALGNLEVYGRSYFYGDMATFNTITVTGDFYVQGNFTTIGSTSAATPIQVLNAGMPLTETGSPTKIAGIEVDNTSTGKKPTLFFDVVAQTWKFAQRITGAAGSQQTYNTSNFSDVNVEISDLTVTKNLVVKGTLTTIDSVDLVVTDKNIIIGNTTTPSDTTADGGGITLKGTTDKKFSWINGTGWESNENINLVAGKSFMIAGVPMFSSNSLGDNIVYSKLTTVGTLVSGVWNASPISDAYIASAAAWNAAAAGKITDAHGDDALNLNFLAGSLTGSVNNATTLTRGVAKFSDADFTVISGLVSLTNSVSQTSTPTFAGLTLSGLLNLFPQNLDAIKLRNSALNDDIRIRFYKRTGLLPLIESLQWELISRGTDNDRFVFRNATGMSGIILEQSGSMTLLGSLYSQNVNQDVRNTAAPTFSGLVLYPATTKASAITYMSGSSFVESEIRLNTQFVGIGKDTLKNLYNGRNAIAIGTNVLTAATTGNYNIGIVALSGMITGSYNTAIGYDAYSLSTAGHDNIVMGYQALLNNTSGNYNIAIGNQAGAQLTSSIHYNVFIGHKIANYMAGSAAMYNVSIGAHSMEYLTSGMCNVGIGYTALRSNDNGINNVAIGHQAGFHILGSGNVVIGYMAGFDESGSNKLYIHNNQGTPLIGGDFSTSSVVINGKLTANTGYYSANGYYYGFSAGAYYSSLYMDDTNISLVNTGSNKTGVVIGQGSMELWSNAVARMIITSVGNIGIGTTDVDTPAEKLDVKGNVAIRSASTTRRFTMKYNDSLDSLDFVFSST